jgi:hypothetical protein
MAGQPMELLTGGAGMYTQQSPTVAPPNANGAALGAAASGLLEPHYGPIALVLIAVLVLFLLDRAGFRFAVTTGKR